MIGALASAMAQHLDPAVMVCLHLPLLLLHVYMEQFSVNGWFTRWYMEQFATTSGLRQKTWVSQESYCNGENFLIMHRNEGRVSGLPFRTFDLVKGSFITGQRLQSLYIAAHSLKSNNVKPTERAYIVTPIKPRHTKEGVTIAASCQHKRDATGL